MLEAVIFDFDLTLADSAQAVIECTGYALERLGLPAAEPEQVRHTIGLTLQRSFAALTGRDDQQLAAEYARHFVSRADEVMVARTQLYPEVPAMLAGLRGRGVRLGVVSSKFRHRIEAILARAGLGAAMDVIVGAEDVTQHKPHPQGLLLALERLQVARVRSVYVGDHPVDAQTAAAAGVAFVAVRTGSGAVESWSGAAPIAIIDGAGGLLQLLERTGRLAGR
jgi:phosphoglycolate phosphatase